MNRPARRETCVSTSSGRSTEITHKTGAEHDGRIASVVKLVIRETEAAGDAAFTEPWDYVHAHIWTHMQEDESDLWAACRLLSGDVLIQVYKDALREERRYESECS